jgi:hypothetical protein
MEIILLLLLFQIKHWYADFKIQTYMQTVKKGVWLHPVGISHSMEHMIGSLLILFVFGFFVPLNMLTVVCLSLSEGIIHYIIDFIKVKYGIKDNTKPLFWNQFGLDQLAHQVTYLAMVWILLVS